MTANTFFIKLFSEGILPGVAGVLSFIPPIAAATFFISLLKNSGIVKNTAAHFVLGFSCSVPAIMTCKSINNKKQRILTMFLIPYMSCSAKLPIYVMLTSMFFPAYPYAVIGSLYTFGIILVLLGIFTAKRTGLWQDPSADKKGIQFKVPSLKIMVKEVSECCIGFIKKAFTVILISSAVIWLLQNLDMDFHFSSSIESSILARTGKLLAPFFVPLGFGDWRAVSALITGLTAKEAIVSSFAVIAGAAEGPALCMMLEDIFDPVSAFCFMIFCLLYTPCIASLAAIKSITGRLSASIAVMAVQTFLAWLVTFLIFQSVKVII